MSLVYKYKNKKLIAGVDEVGRGSLVGPVYAAAVILNKKINKKKLKDSKKLTKEKRENLDKYIGFYKSSPYNGFNAIAVIMFNEKESKVRLAVMENLVIKNEKNAYAHFNQGNVALLEEEYELAVKSANKALELTPGWTMAKTLRAKANFEDGNMKLALQDMKALVKAEPEQKEFRTTYARI